MVPTHRQSRTLSISHQCCSVHALTNSIGCYGYYDLESGEHSGGLRLFRVRADPLGIEELAEEWHVADAGIYEFQVRQVSELVWYMYAVDTRSRVWLIECTRNASIPNEFRLLQLDVVTVSKRDAQSQCTSVRVDNALGLLSVTTMSGELQIADLRDMRTLWRLDAAHDCEILSTAIIPRHRLVATGSEDMTVKFWDARQTADASSCLRIKNCHTAGVTALSGVAAACGAEASDYLLTGSYDDCVRLFDLRSPTEPVDVLKTQGGAWDFVWSAQFPGNFLLPNCFGGLQRGFLANVGGPLSSWGAASAVTDEPIDSSPQAVAEVGVDTCVHLTALIAPAQNNESALYYGAAWFCHDTVAVTASFYERNLVVVTIEG